MLKSSVFNAFATIALLAALTGGCNTSDPQPETKPLQLTVSHAPPSSQPIQIVAELGALGISRTDLDSLLYESYGLRMLFDLVELDLAKSTLLTERGQTLQPADVQRERQLIMTKMMADAAPSDYDNLFEQFLQREHISRAEFEIKVVQTDACLRKIIEPIVVGKIPEDKIHRAFEQLYGAKRVIADIELANYRDANIARQRCRTEPFEKVAMEMSIDRTTGANGGVWPAFSSQSTEVHPVILEAAFSMDENQISDVLQARTTCHIIKVLKCIPPMLMKYEDVKASVQKQLEDTLIESDIKRLREALTEKAQAQVQIDDPILKAQWDEIIARSKARNNDPTAIKKQMDDRMKRDSATAPATMP